MSLLSGFLDSIIYYYNINRRKMVEKDSLREAVFQGKSGRRLFVTVISENMRGDKKKYLTPEQACDRITTP
jgi:hypothetical protein